MRQQRINSNSKWSFFLNKEAIDINDDNKNYNVMIKPVHNETNNDYITLNDNSDNEKL